MRLIDADVIIRNWRGQEDAALLLADSPFAVSAATYMELVQGMRNRREFARLRADLKLSQVRLLPVTEPVLVAATALQHDLLLVSSNSRDFRPIHDLRLEAFRPRARGSPAACSRGT
jgi:hypothetical protein